MIILVVAITRWVTLSDEQKRTFIVSVRRIVSLDKIKDKGKIKSSKETSVSINAERKDKNKATSQQSANKSFSMKCENCGATLDLDLDNLLAYCPYCGNKLLIDVSQLGQILTEREKTKREEQRTKQAQERTEQLRYQKEVELEKIRMETESKERIEKRKSKAGSAVFIFLGFVAFLFFILLAMVGYYQNH